MKSFNILHLLFLTITIHVHGQITDVPTVQENTNIQYYIDGYTKLSDEARGLPKIIQISPNIIESSDLNWPKGSWGRGLFPKDPNSNTEYLEKWKNTLFYEINDCAQEINPPIDITMDDGEIRKLNKKSVQGYSGSHPFTHTSSKMLRAHIHTANKYGQYVNGIDNHEIIKDGLNYLIDQQVTDETSFFDEEIGGYRYWWYRPSITVPNINDDAFPLATNKLTPINQYGYNICTNQVPVHSYQTSYALRAMAQGYYFIKENNIPYDNLNKLLSPDKSSGAIIDAADNLLMQLDRAINDGYDCWISNSNYKGLMAWGLASAYKVTGNCEYLDGAIWLTKELIRLQNRGNGNGHGTWLTPDPSGQTTNDCTGSSYFHDSRIHYTQIILRGLVETFDAIPHGENGEFYYFKLYLKTCIEKAVNHIINKRISFTNDNIGFYKLDYLNTKKGPNGEYLEEEIEDNCIEWVHNITEDIIEPIATLTVYSKYSGAAYFNPNNNETEKLRKLLIAMGTPLGYQRWDYFPTTATYADYLDASKPENNRRIFPTSAPMKCYVDRKPFRRSYPNGLPTDFNTIFSNTNAPFNSEINTELRTNIDNFNNKKILSVKNIAINSNLYIYDITGQKVYEKLDISNSNLSIDLSKFNTNQLYIIKTETLDSNSITTKKIVIE